MTEKEGKDVTVKDIVAAYLEVYGYDGLYGPPHNLCGCKVGDLFPCGCDGSEDCKPGYFGVVDPDEDECEFIIQAEKPA